LKKLFSDYLATGDEKSLTKFLVSKSNLPGPRGNLELASEFIELVEINFSRDLKRLWTFCTKAIRISPVEAPVNDPKEFLPFCGAYAIGAIGSVSPAYFSKALFRLRELSEDSRWRTREAVAMGIQKMLGRKPEETMRALEGWIESNNWLVMRAIAAGVAEPLLLRNTQTARKALEIHKKIIAKILVAKERKSPEFKTMRKGLCYTLSVVVWGIPHEGFIYINKIACSKDADVLWIVKQNLGKKRLSKNFPDEVASLRKLF